MTRNILDDLTISTTFFISYITFLQENAQKNIELLEFEYNNFSISPVENTAYILHQIEEHISSTIAYLEYLNSIKKMVSDFHAENQKPLPLHAISLYHQNLHTHKKKLLYLIEQLLK